MLSLKDCIAMADIPESRLRELEQREHLPVMLAVAIAAQRREGLVLTPSEADGARRTRAAQNERLAGTRLR